MVYYNVTGYNSDMFLAGILSWWYGDGLVRCFKSVKNQLIKLIDFFSIDLLITTLFAPFRQISVGGVNGPMNAQIGALFDNLISRFVGASVRLFMMTLGVLAIFLQSLFGIFLFLLWIVVPFLPVIGLTMALIGVVI